MPGQVGDIGAVEMLRSAIGTMYVQARHFELLINMVIDPGLRAQIAGCPPSSAVVAFHLLSYQIMLLCHWVLLNALDGLSENVALRHSLRESFRSRCRSRCHVCAADTQGTQSMRKCVGSILASESPQPEWIL